MDIQNQIKQLNVIADLLVDNMYRNRERNENNNNAPYLGQQSIRI